MSPSLRCIPLLSPPRALCAAVLAVLLAAPAGAEQCEVIDLNHFQHGEAISTLELFGSELTLTVTGLRNEPFGPVSVTAYDTERWDDGANPPPNSTHYDTQRFILCNPAANGGNGECDGIIAVIPDKSFEGQADDTQGGFITITGFDGLFEIPRFDAVDVDDNEMDVLLRVGDSRILVGESSALGNATVETVFTDPHQFSDVVEIEFEGSNGIDDIEICRLDEPFCGDGIVDPDEECDDGNEIDDDACRNDCTLPFCGDGFLDPGESCDDGNEIDDDACRNDCSACGDGVLDDVEECDDGNNDGGDGCSATCENEEGCALTVEKFCAPIAAPAGLACDDRPVQVVFEYVGQACQSPLPNAQGGKASCSGDASGADPVSIAYVGKDPAKFSLSPASGISDGDLVTFTATGRDELHADSKFEIRSGGTLLQSLAMHTSCSQPFSVGDEFGSLRVVEFTEKDGEVRSAPEPAEASSECEVPAGSSAPACQGKVEVLTFRYLGGSCSQGNNSQDGKAECSGDATGVSPVRVLYTGKDPEKFTVSPSGPMQVGDLVSVAATGRSEFHADSSFEIRDGAGALVQTLKLHTSCSQPLDPGDIFGALEVVALDTTEGGSAGANVAYTYVIENVGGTTVTGVTVEDDLLGSVPGSPLASLVPGEVVELTAEALISSTTTNTVEVEGETAEGAVCTASASATATAVRPPASCADGKPQELVFEYTGGSCADAVNGQSKDSCTGDAQGASNVSIVVTKDAGDVSVSPATGISVGDLVRFTATGDRLKAETVFDIRSGGQTLQSINIHTSCSDVLVVGDEFGGMRLVEFVPES